jgi:hypothetical protein
MWKVSSDISEVFLSRGTEAFLFPKRTLSHIGTDVENGTRAFLAMARFHAQRHKGNQEAITIISI